MTPRHMVGYAAIAFVLFFVIKNPHGAEHVVSNIGDFLSSVPRTLSGFLESL